MRRPDGFAMVAALFALLLVSLLATRMAALSRDELRVAQSAGRAAAALAALDECTARVLVTLPLGLAFDHLLAGPDGIAGTADDGRIPAPPACTARASAVAGPGALRIRLDLEARRGGGTRVGAALVGRASYPGPPALLWIPDGAGAGSVHGRLALDGGDADVAPPWAGFAAASDPPVLDAWLAVQPGRIEPSLDTADPIWAPAPPVAVVIDDVRAASASTPAAALVPIAAAPVRATLADGDLQIADERWGRGILAVGGRLEVAGRLEFRGLVVAAGGVAVRPGGSLRVGGAIWTGAAAPAIDVAGSMAVSRDLAGLGEASGLVALPRQARLHGWLDR